MNALIQHSLRALCLLVAMFFVATGVSYAQDKDILTDQGVVLAKSFDTTKLSKRAKFNVRFTAGGGKYAFDEGREDWLQDSKLLRDEFYKPFGDNYVAPWKLVPVGETDRVTATLAGPAEGVDRSKIKFVTAQGKGIAATDDGQAWTLTVPAIQVGKTIDIYAVYEPRKGKLLTVGKLRVVSYTKQRHSVTLVPVGVASPDVSELQTKLNAIYAPYGVEFAVKADEAIKELEGWKGRTFKLEGNGFFTRENADMAEVRKAYQAVRSTPKGSYYVFVLGRADASSEDAATQANGAQGDMPRGQQFGYVFGDGVQDWSWLLAHELGHGVFTLQHLEDGNYGAKGQLGSVANLMNYTRSTELQAFQWNIMSNPAILTAFDSDDASKAIASDIVSWWSDLNNLIIKEAQLENTVRFHIKTKTLPNGTVIKLQLFDKDRLSPDDDDFDGKQVFKEIKITNNEATFELELPVSWTNDLIDEPFVNYRNLYWRIVPTNTDLKTYLQVRFSDRTLYIERSPLNNGSPQMFTSEGDGIAVLDLTKMALSDLKDKGLEKSPKVVWAVIKNTSTTPGAGVTIITAAKKVGTLVSFVELTNFMRGSLTNEYPKHIPLPIVNYLSPIVDHYTGWVFDAVDQSKRATLEAAKKQGLQAVEQGVRAKAFNTQGVEYQMYYLPPAVVEDILSGKIKDNSLLSDYRDYVPGTVFVLVRSEKDEIRKLIKSTIEAFFIKTD